MNRLQKKCLYVSLGTHGLLVVILFVGPAFFTSSDQLTTHQLLTVIPLNNIVDDAPSTGGNPNVHTAPPPTPEPTPEPPAPQVRPQPKPPTPVKENDPPKPPKTQTTKPSEFTPVKTPAVKPTPSTTQSDSSARRSAENATKVANAINRGARSLTKDFSPSTSVEMPGPGGAELMAANYNDVVASIYTHAWAPPPSLDDESAVVTTSITISRTGKVVAHRITKSSGNASMDKSIETTLDNVTFIAPFPPSSRDVERTFTINFSLKAKRLLG